jgi:hypothetical protein
MTEITKETITTQGTTISPIVAASTITVATNSQTIEYLTYFFFGALEILLGFRFVLKLMGASFSSFFVRVIYGLSGVFILPFKGIFHRGFTQGLETTSVIEPSTLVAIIVYVVLAWGIVKLIKISSGERQAE